MCNRRSCRAVCPLHRGSAVAERRHHSKAVPVSVARGSPVYCGLDIGHRNLAVRCVSLVSLDLVFASSGRYRNAAATFIASAASLVVNENMHRPGRTTAMATAQALIMGVLPAGTKRLRRRPLIPSTFGRHDSERCSARDLVPWRDAGVMV
ncbi:hypothetical protein GY45DRAFT_1319457 [Cubamyces sp. BRFM 1775]|nr:hypothetical protein GY45DRAFT_1319457 [Cubamyces sp. BRFM 1775]